MAVFLKKKVCIVGSGFCGYTIYTKLLQDNLDLIVIEGGDILNPKSSKDQPYYKTKVNKYSAQIKGNNKFYKILNNLDLSFRDRRYTLGGSSEGWTGMIKPFEETTYLNKFKGLETQNWGKLNFKKYSNEALDILKSPLHNFDPYQLAQSLNIPLVELPKGLFYTVYAWAEEPVRLKNYWKNRSTSDSKLINNVNNVLYGYKLIDAKINEGKIEELVFKSEKNEELIIDADIFVIGMGGIENAKFANKLNIKNLINNKENKLIGNFQEHPHFYWVGQFNLGVNHLPNIFTERIPYTSGINGNKGYVKFSIGAWDGIGSPKVTFDIVKYENKFKGFLKYATKFISFRDYHIHIRCEQTPNKNSIINFNDSYNSLNWEISDSDIQYYMKYLNRLASFLEKNNFIREFKSDYKNFRNAFVPKEVFGAGHHMGTFPYTQNKENIDEHFRHKDFKNTYFVGCSTFPTSGFENPTHTAIASTLSVVEDIKLNIK